MELDKAKNGNNTPLETISGEIDQILHYSDNGFFIAILIRTGDRNAKVLGTATSMPPVGAFMTATGRWQRNPNPQFNEMQFKIVDFQLSMPKDVRAVIKLLTGLKGIGDVRAHRIVDRLGEDALEKILADYHCIVGLSSIGEVVAQRAAEDLKQLSNDADVERILAQIGLGAKARKAVLAEKSPAIILAMLEKDPYKLASLPRVTFQKVDRFVLVTKRVEASSVRRGAAVAIESLRRYCSLGHTFASLDQLVRSAKKLDLAVPIDPRAIEAGVKYAMSDGMLVDVGNGRVALPTLAQAEDDIAAIIKGWLSDPFELGSTRSIDQQMVAMLTNEQKQAVKNAIAHRVSIITGGPGVGKCFAPGTPVLMFDGTIKPIEEIRVGEKVMGDDGTVRRVTRTSHGRSEMFDVIPKFGDPFTVNENHIITFKLQERRKQNGREISGLAFKTMHLPVKDFLASPKRLQEKAKLFRVAVPFRNRAVPLDPYFLGLWLGDGSNGRVGITSQDQPIIDYVHRFAAQHHMNVTKSDSGGSRTPTWFIVDPVNPRRNVLYDQLRRLSVANNKHIPHLYKTNSLAVRRAVLAGIIDTDGSKANNGCYEITTKYPALANDIAFVARSLGYAVSIAPKTISEYPGRVYHRVVVSGAHDLDLLLQHKKSTSRRQVKNVLHTGFQIKSAGHGEYYGIEIDGNHLHLLGDFTVVHNTFVSKAVLAAMAGSTIFIVAPTGKAACRAHQLTKIEASTIHRFLGKVNVELQPRDDQDPKSPEQIIPQVVLVDETSMVDTELFAELLRTLNKRQGARLVIVGDVDQLPSIGAGRVLADLIESGAVPVTRLTQVQRQKGDSSIVANAYQINQAARDARFSLREAADFVIVEHSDPKVVRARMVEYLTQRLRGEGFDLIDQVQVLSGQRKHSLGTEELNVAIRRLLNPGAPNKPELLSRTGESLFRVGDKVMCTVNNYTLGVVNGDQGVVIAVQNADKEHKPSVTVRFKGEEINDVVFEDDDIETLVQAWAVTVHKSQGSEYPVVLVVCHNELSWALQRALLYTAVTRGKERVVIFGTREDIRKAALAENLERYTRLGQLLYNAKA